MTEFGPGGQRLWDAIAAAHELDAQQEVQLTEACRMKDRLDKLDELLRGDVGAWATIEDFDGRPSVLVISSALDKANATANVMKQLLAAMRLPDSTGKRPQQRGGARGSYGAQTPGGGTVSSIDRARKRKQA